MPSRVNGDPDKSGLTCIPWAIAFYIKNHIHTAETVTDAPTWWYPGGVEMKIHRELELKGEQAAVLAVIERVSNQPGAGWSRNRQAEEELKRMGSQQTCFESAESSNTKPSRLWVSWNNKDSYARVTNIVPTKGGGLELSEYNKILEDFVSKNRIRQLGQEHGIEVLLTPDDVDIGYWHLSERSVELLRFFSGAANKSTGSAHPKDRERWFKFLISAHNDKSTLTTDILGRWLCEEEGWPEDTAADLRLQYEFARDLLNVYDPHIA